MDNRQLQKRSRALLPLGVGHALAVAAAIAVALVVGVVIPIHHLRWPVAGILISLGVMRLFRHKHPRWASMRVGMGGLTLWSFLMATAHGAGLMVVPIFMGMAMARSGGQACHGVAAASAGTGPALLATALHAVGYLAVTAVLAVVVFEKFGVGLLRRAWFNLDLIWAATLIVTGTLTLSL
jgi:hypothetical protein